MDIIRWDSWNSFHCAVIKSDTDANYLVGSKGKEGGDVFRIAPFVFWLQLGALYCNNYHEFLKFKAQCGDHLVQHSHLKVRKSHTAKLRAEAGETLNLPAAGAGVALDSDSQPRSLQSCDSGQVT